MIHIILMMMMWLKLKRNPRVKIKSESISPDVESEMHQLPTLLYQRPIPI